MRTDFKEPFLKFIKKLNDKGLKSEIEEIIVAVEKAKTVGEIKNIKKLTGYKSYYRIRIGDYRIGLKIESGLAIFVIIDHRKDIYKRFP